MNPVRRSLLILVVVATFRVVCAEEMIDNSFPDEPEIATKLTAWHKQIGEERTRSRAKQNVETFLEARPEHIGALSLLCSIADMDKDYLGQKKYALVGLLVAPEQPALTLHLAMALMHLGEFVSARTYFERIIFRGDDASIVQHAKQIYTQKFPMSMLQHAMTLLNSNSSAPSRSIPFFLASATDHPDTYLKAAGQVIAAVQNAGMMAVSHCKLKEAVDLLDTWIRASQTHRIGITKGLMSLASQAYQVRGEYIKSREIANSCIQQCTSKAEKRMTGADNEWEACAHCYQLARRYDEAFALIRDAHAAAREGPHNSLTYDKERRILPNTVTIMRLEHDAEQVEYLYSKGRFNDSVPVEDILTTYTEAVQFMKKLPPPPAPPGMAEVTQLLGLNEFPVGLRTRMERYYNKAYYIVPESKEPWREAILNPAQDFAQISKDFNAGEVVVIDEFLTPKALEVMERIGHENQMWHETKLGNYVGSMSNDGFGPAPLARLAKELEAAMPDVFGEHTLIMHWGFKHDSHRGREGIKAHADTAAINLNFWVTHDDANMDKESGGLTVYDKRLGKGDMSDDFTKYNSNSVDSKSLGFTEADIKKKVYYKQNRCVLFHSSYFHETDPHKFKPGYTNRRINFTLLFGFAESVRCSGCEEMQGEFCTNAIPQAQRDASRGRASSQTEL